MRQSVAGVLGLCLLATTGWSETRVLFSGRTSPIEDLELYSMKADGTDFVQLTTNTLSEAGARLNPAGDIFAYLNPDGAGTNISFMPVTGGPATAIACTGKILALEWADADTLCYLRDNGGGDYSVWRIDTNGANNVRMWTTNYMNNAMGMYELDVWSNRLYMTAIDIQPYRSRIHAGTIGATTHDTVLAVQTPLNEMSDIYGPTLSPDATKLAYIGDFGTGGHQLYVGARDGSGSATMIGDTFCGSPAWAPDSSWLAVTRATASTYGITFYVGDIVTCPAGGGALTNLTTTLPVASRCCFPVVYTVGSPPPPDPDPDKDGMNDEWESAMFGSATNALFAADLDCDGDGLSNRREFAAGTSPTNRHDLFMVQTVFSNGLYLVHCGLLPGQGPGYDGMTRTYCLEQTTNLSGTIEWAAVPGASNLPGAARVMLHTNATDGNTIYYRVRATLK